MIDSKNKNQFCRGNSFLIIKETWKISLNYFKIGYLKSFYKG